PERIAAELQRRPAKLVALVHAETSTGAWQPVEDVATIAHEHGALFAIDCVTSLGGVPVDIDAWGVDAAGSCSQKCLGSPPGFARGLERLGLELFTPAAQRLPQLNVIKIPAGVDDALVRRKLLERGIEIAAGFGPLKGKTWRVGLMGYNATPERVDLLLNAME